jgi:hypothetical protein
MNGDQQARPATGEQVLTKEQALEIFKMYEDKGWAVKQQMLTMVTWLTPIVFGLIAFCAKDYFSDQLSTTTQVAGWTGFALSFFMSFLVVMSLLHANRDYERAHQVIEHARDKLLWQDVLNVILDKEKLYVPKGFRHIGWQFKLIMGFACLLVLITLPIAICLR